MAPSSPGNGDEKPAIPGYRPDAAGRRGRRRKGSFLRELPLLVVTALVLTFLIQTFFGRVYVIPSQSMERTLHGCVNCVDDRVLVDKVSYQVGDPQPGDVVVFRGPDSWGESEFGSARSDNAVVRVLQEVGSLVGLAAPDEHDFVKRVIAVGGQTVQCCDAQHRVVVNGKPLDEPYLFWLPGTGPADQTPFGPITVPDGKLFVMGDNRMNSADSRVQGGGGENGTVPVKNVIGKARLIVLPPGRWSGVTDYNPQALGAPR